MIPLDLFVLCDFSGDAVHLDRISPVFDFLGLHGVPYKGIG